MNVNGSKVAIRKRRIGYRIDENGCYICVTHKARRAGYPSFKRKGKLILGHRYIYEKFYGSIPEGLLVRHKCDNRECINPKHLELGTYQDNYDDMVERGRVNKAKGNSIWASKLTKTDVLKIRKLLSKGYSHSKIAKMYLVSKCSITCINTGKSWNWL